MPRPTPKNRKPYSAKKAGPKSFKADGTPKNRWSPVKRAEAGLDTRRGSARPWERDERRPGKFQRDNRSARFDRDERPARDDRGPREERPYREDGPRRSDSRGRNFAPWSPKSGANRDDRDERGFDRDDRGSRGYGSRDDRPRRDFDRDDRGGRSFNRDDRGPRGYGSRDDRPRRDFDRDDRGGRSFKRDDRGPRGYGSRDDRPRRDFDRDDRGGRGFKRDDRPARKEYPAARPFHPEPRPRVEPRAERKPWEPSERKYEKRFEERTGRRFERDDRGDRGFDRGDRKPWQRDDRGPRSFNRDDRSEGFGGEENADQMSWEATDLGEIDASGVTETEGFAALGVPAILVAALDKQGIKAPFPIQAATIPDAIAGRDVLGRGQTGSGKTLGFGLPMLTRISTSEKTGGAPRGLVLVPTRELALQCADVLAPLAKTVGLSLTLIAGGMSYVPQRKAFDRGVDIVVATPGRLIDLLEQGDVDLTQVQTTVLDEADHMADLGFMPAVTTLMDTVPADGQRLLFSATLDHAVDRIVKKYLHDPITHEVDSDRASVSTMEHRLLHVMPHEKNKVTAEIANREGRTVLFARTQMGASRIAEQLREQGVMAGALHGGLTQGARTRILAAFKEGTVPVLVATDVAARGIHVDDVTLVLEVDPPMNSKDYLHRAGRTARAGTKGVVASIVLPHQKRMMARLVGQAGVKVEPVETRPGSDELSEITGSRPTSGEAIDERDYEALIAPKKFVRGPRQGGGRGFKGGRGGGYRGDRDRGGFRGDRGGRGGWNRDDRRGADKPWRRED